MEDQYKRRITRYPPGLKDQGALTDKEHMRCTGGLGLPLATVLRRLLMAALLACLASLTLLAPSALADDLPASDPPAATDPAAAPPAADPSPEPPAAGEPAPGAPATHPVHPTHPVDPAPVVDPPPIVDPVVGPPAVQLPVDPVPNLPDPVATIDIPSTADEPGGPVAGAAGDTRPTHGSPADVAYAPSQPEPVASDPTSPQETPAAAPEPVAVVIPAPDALAPASWRWPRLATPGSPSAAPAALTGSFLSGAPAVMVPSTLPGDGGATAGHRGATRHAPPSARSQPAPWSPSAPGSPFSASATPPAGAAGGLGGWALACLLFVLLALAAPRRVLPRPALSPVLTLRPAHAPARAPPAS